MDVTDERWAVLEPLIPSHRAAATGAAGCGGCASEALNCVLWWVLRTAAP